jgi:hypothetical protein
VPGAVRDHAAKGRHGQLLQAQGAAQQRQALLQRRKRAAAAAAAAVAGLAAPRLRQGVEQGGAAGQPQPQRQPAPSKTK